MKLESKQAQQALADLWVQLHQHSGTQPTLAEPVPMRAELTSEHTLRISRNPATTQRNARSSK